MSDGGKGDKRRPEAVSGAYAAGWERLFGDSTGIEMACKPCAARRKALAAKKAKKQAEGKQVQAAALGAVLAVSEAAGKVMGIHGEGEDEREGKDQPGDGL